MISGKIKTPRRRVGRPLAFILLAALMDVRSPADTNDIPINSPRDAAPAAAAEDAAANSLIDPFAYYRLPQDADAFVPAVDANIPPGISVMAILELDADAAYAALRIPGRPDVIYVKKEDVVRVEFNGSASAGKTHNTIYLKIRKIDAQGVEISPVERPSEVHVFQ